MAAPLIYDVASCRRRELIERGGEFITLCVNERLDLVAHALCQAEFDQELDAQVAYMVDRLHKPPLQCGLALARCAHDGAIRACIAGLCRAVLDQAGLAQSSQSPVDERAVNGQNATQVRLCLKLAGDSESMGWRLAHERQHNPLGQREFRSGHLMTLPHSAK